ncbi:Peptidyl-prolyl cis-trans isomerase CWC27 like protein [Eufriesea mexicana]|uniref:Spliceosome-associated protein CWC27 homolog n=1 Tax=Eufriesea mexicana TaxID=516756 RepID=A0A310S5A6_9HYME|nr:Peptidyl-prolyl cis-trans isomerase CWC27 like protein [Eufriesea mexicana]
MKTTVGDIELELCAKETPMACRNFLQLWRISYKITFFRRDLIAIAIAEKDDNGSQFFFTRSSTSDLQNKHTVFGKVTGETNYNMLKLEEALVDEIDKPHFPPRLIKTIILNNPFSDIIPRIIVQEREEVKDSSKTKPAVVKDFHLLSFGGEAKEDEEESVILNKKFTGKGKSAHDHLTDPKLSSQPAVEPPGPPNKKRKKDCNSNWESDDEVKTQVELAVTKKEKELVYCLHYNYNDGAEVYKEKRQIRVKAVRRGSAHYVESRNRKGAAYISTEKDVWHEHTDIRIIEEMENEHLVIVIKIKDELNIECKCFITAQMCRNIYGNLETTKAAEILGLWHMELIRSRKPTLKGGKRYVLPTDDYWRKEPFG